MLIQLTPEYFAYYKRTSTRVKRDYGHMVDYWKSYLADEYQMTSFQEEKIQDQANKKLDLKSGF